MQQRVHWRKLGVGSVVALHWLGEEKMLCCFVFLLEVVVEIRESQSVRGIEPPRDDFEDERAKAYGVACRR